MGIRFTSRAASVKVVNSPALVAAIIQAPRAGASGSASLQIGLSENTDATIPVQSLLFEALRCQLQDRQIPPRYNHRLQDYQKDL